ncbi:MAG: flagellar hook-basal body complex protein [Thermoguttaceae bacterium]
MPLSLNQALNTASMGMHAAESSINVIGNNLANANTVGFKSNRADFADMFYRSYSFGTAPKATNGGTNPTQIGLGVTLAGVSTNFTQGTVKDGMTPTDMAIEGDGFFILQPDASKNVDRYYSRNGVMKINGKGELINTSGLYVMGYGINDRFEIQTDKLSKINIPLGEMKIAEATENVVLDGILNATGQAATQGTVLASTPLTDLSYTSPGATMLDTSILPRPSVEMPLTTATGVDAGGAVTSGDYIYRFVYVDAAGVESDYSAPIEVTVGENENGIKLADLPAANPNYSSLRIYRADAPSDPADPGVFYRVTDLPLADNPTEYTDLVSSSAIEDPANVLDQSRLTGNYTYYVTYTDANGNESRPSYLSNVQSVSGGQIQLSNIPVIDPANNPDGWTGRNIYRCAAQGETSYFLVGSVNNMDPKATLVDKTPDTELVNHQPLSMAGRGEVLANSNTKLVNIGQHYTDGRFVPLFEQGTLEFTPVKGEANLKTQSLEITGTTTIGKYLNFVSESFGLRSAGTDNIPPDQGEIGKLVNNGSPGATIIDGSIVILGNAGGNNALRIDATSFKLTTASDGKNILDMPFTQLQAADGESISMSMEVYDSLGAPVNVKMTMVLQEKTDTETIYRWYADSDDNHPLTGNAIGLGTGLIKFDSNGAFVDSTNTTITVERTDEASKSPMSFTFDMNMATVAALSTTKPGMTMKSQDGAGAGVLTEFAIADDGTVYGSFSSNVTRPLGQVLLATFVNNEGLIRKGDNLFSEGPDSGNAKIQKPDSSTVGRIRNNAIELSNTDIGQELIDMILASTMYQANTKIISTTNVMMDSLLRVVG